MSEFTYTFYPPNAPKPGVTFAYLYDHFPSFNGGSGGPEGYELIFKRELTPSELQEFTEWFNSWNQPSRYLSFFKSETYSLSTERIKSNDLQVVNSFIMAGFSPADNEEISLASLKTIIGTHTNNVENFANYSGTDTVTIQLYSLTLDTLIIENVINLAEVTSAWKTKALANETGKVDTWKTHQVFGIDNYLPSYDCIWQWRVSCTHPDIEISLNGQQRLFYRVFND